MWNDDKVVAETRSRSRRPQASHPHNDTESDDSVEKIQKACRYSHTESSIGGKQLQRGQFSAVVVRRPLYLYNTNTSQ